MTETARDTAGGRLLVAAGVGAAVAVFFGVYGSVHDPAGQQTVTLFFDDTLDAKAALTAVALGLALVQMYTALRMFGKLGSGEAPAWFGPAHRLSGTLAFVATLPVAFHCLWSLGFVSETATDVRPLLHSLLGCFFYGAFAAKVVIVRSRGLPGWALPVAGGAVFTAIVALFLTSAMLVFTGTVGG